jgi:hypothetical protein
MHHQMIGIFLLQNLEQFVHQVVQNFYQNVDIINHNQQYQYVDYVMLEYPL